MGRVWRLTIETWMMDDKDDPGTMRRQTFSDEILLDSVIPLLPKYAADFEKEIRENL